MAPLQIIFIAPLLFLSGFFTLAQNPSLVRFEDLTFYSEFEKKAFQEFQGSENDYLRLFLAVSPAADENTFNQTIGQISRQVEMIRFKKYDKLKNEKKVERSYELVNGDVLKRYQEVTLFPEILSKGDFNCLTASAYYGLVFSRLGIEFEFIANSNHVHPVAFPRTLQIKVETTDPLYGFQYFDDKLKSQFVNYLLTSKVINRDDLTNASNEDIFNKYYFPSSGIGLKELAGLQYLNDAFYNFSRENFSHAFKQSLKSYYLYPSDQASTVILFLLSRCISETDYKTVEDVSYLAFASRFVGEGLRKEDFTSEFNKLTEAVLIQKSQTALYDQMYAYLIERIDSGEVHDAVEMYYCLNKGKTFLTTFRIKEALLYFEKALLIEPESIEIQSYAVQSLALSFSTAPSQEVVNNLENFELRFPVMQTNQAFITLQMLGYLRLGEEKFDFNKPSEGEALIKKFENLFHLHSGTSIDYETVGNAYSAAAVYYFKRENTAMARSYLNRGLRISPDNYKLIYRLRALE